MSGSRASSIALSAAVSAAVAVAGPVLVVIAIRHSIPVVGISLAYAVLFAAMVVAASLNWQRPSRRPTASVDPLRRSDHRSVGAPVASRKSASGQTVQ
jgi:hypothetical protein